MRKNKKPAHNLTPRQEQVLRLVVKGHTAREIGPLLRISPRTVEYHKYRLMDHLNLRSSADLIRYGIEHGLLAG